jgi:hypothetical protein
MEWFAPGHAPTDSCRWHDSEGGVQLPVEYAEWMELAEPPRTPPQVSGSSRPTPATRSVEAFRIVSPNEGDVYRMPPGVEARYATVGLRAAGGPGEATVRWMVDGSPYRETRWPLQPGRHRFRAVTSAGDSAEVTVSVE